MFDFYFKVINYLKDPIVWSFVCGYFFCAILFIFILVRNLRQTGVSLLRDTSKLFAKLSQKGGRKNSTYLDSYAHFKKRVLIFRVWVGMSGLLLVMYLCFLGIAPIVRNYAWSAGSTSSPYTVCPTAGDNVSIDGDNITVNGNITFQANETNAGIIDCSGKNLILGGSSIITFENYNDGDSNYTDDYGVTLNANNLTIGSNAKIIANGQGYISDSGEGAGSYLNTCGGGGGAGYGGGGGIGGPGPGELLSGDGGATYGSAVSPLALGSGGAGTNITPGIGGTGGGVIRLNITMSLALDGTITADGLSGGMADVCSGEVAGGGGGSGGSIYISTYALVGEGSIQAKGGDGGVVDADAAGGGGGGGRISVYYQVRVGFSGSLLVTGGSGYEAGAIGTANYYKGPNTPLIVSPLYGATGVARNVTIQSSAYSGNGGSHASSDWQICADSGCATVLANATDDADDLTSITATIGTGKFTTTIGQALEYKTRLSLNTTYYVRVRHADEYGDSGWSDVSVFTTTSSDNRPDKPTNVSPAHLATGVSKTPTLTGNAFVDADGDAQYAAEWHIYDTEQGCGGTTTWDSAITTTSLTSINVPSGFLAGSVTYIWNVRYQDETESEDGWSLWSTCSYFTVANTTPVLLSSISTQNLTQDIPSNNAFDLDDYFSDDDVGQTLTYSTETAPAHIDVTIDGDNQVSFSPYSQWAGTETVRFQADDGHSGTVLSNSVTINVANVNDAPNKSSGLSELSPVDGESNVTSFQPTIGWSAANDPDTADTSGTLHYILQIGTSSDPSNTYDYKYITADGDTSINMALDIPVGESSPVSLVEDTIYYFAIKTVDDEGAESGWLTRGLVFLVHTGYGTISGTVKNNNGSVFAGETLRLYQGDTLINSVTSGGDGVYSFVNVAAGSYSVSLVEAGSPNRLGTSYSNYQNTNPQSVILAASETISGKDIIYIENGGGGVVIIFPTPSGNTNSNNNNNSNPENNNNNNNNVNSGNTNTSVNSNSNNNTNTSQNNNQNTNTNTNSDTNLNSNINSGGDDNIGGEPSGDNNDLNNLAPAGEPVVVDNTPSSASGGEEEIPESGGEDVGRVVVSFGKEEKIHEDVSGDNGLLSRLKAGVDNVFDVVSFRFKRIVSIISGREEIICLDGQIDSTGKCLKTITPVDQIITRSKSVLWRYWWLLIGLLILIAVVFTYIFTKKLRK